DGKVDRDSLGTYLCSAPNIPKIAKIIHTFSLADEEDEIGFLPCKKCGERLPPGQIDIMLEDDEGEEEDEYEPANLLTNAHDDAPISRRGFAMDELRELADMLREAKDEPEPINY